MDSNEIFELWKKHHHGPYHFEMDHNTWNNSMYHDTDSDGRKLFTAIEEAVSSTGYIQFARTAFGFDENGEISEDVQYRVIRCICFDDPAEGQKLLDTAMDVLGRDQRIFAYFHYFGMSACGRHGKLHDRDRHIHDLLLSNGFEVEHENVYYARTLTEKDLQTGTMRIAWSPLNQGSCRNFTAFFREEEIGWGQVHFLPQGDIAYLRWIYIAQERQHHGYGTAVMKALFSDLYRQGIRRFDTDTALQNSPAQRYYEKNGFTNEGITRSYFTK